MNMSKIRTERRSMTVDEKLYYDHLTNHAYNFIEQQLKKYHNETLTLITGKNNNHFMVDKDISVTISLCNCQFNTRMRLPCTHILKARETCNLPPIR